MNLTEYYQNYGDRLAQPSERLFLDECLYPLLGDAIERIIPQQPFIDSTGRRRRMDFAYIGASTRLALEVDGESYHAEGIIPNELFDDSLFRQNEILRLGYRLIRFSYSQLQSPSWRPLVQESLRDFFGQYAPELLTPFALRPTALQDEALSAIAFYRDDRAWSKGLIILPTGTGKTILSALDARRHGGKVLFLVHRLDILKQSIDAYKIVWPEARIGTLTGEVRENEMDCDVLFASKDTLRRTSELERFGRNWFDYIVVDEVHHGQSPSYREVLQYFEPSFMLGMTATPDRTDRKDIFELFGYNKLYEISLNEVIERGFLVPFTYYGLTDDVDYSRIRYENQKYRVDDLERHLIIPERNESIVREYIERGDGDKAIGFCVSINHANRMAEEFSRNSIPSAAIHSQSQDRDQILRDFREDKLHVVFTVDLFNEGIDIPNVRVLLFLRPTESRTVFMQQLGRGLRLSRGKERVRVLDFIGNYRRANQIRKYLSKGASVVQGTNGDGRTRRKLEYIYTTGCEVHFDSSVEELLDRQDAEELGISKEDLKEAYFALAETLGTKPTRIDLDSQGEYKSAQYARLFGSWVGFLREVGEYTEASYHYPQGVHLGHILSILYVFGGAGRSGSHLDDQYIRLRGALGEGRLGTYQRQIKYKLLAAMELGLITDDRNFPPDAAYSLELTPLGHEVRRALEPVLNQFDLTFPVGSDGIPATRMRNDERDYNQAIREHIAGDALARDAVFRTFLTMPAIRQMMVFLYHVARTRQVARREIYDQFFRSPFVKQFCDQEGIEEATIEASRRRCPFLLNILDACGIVESARDHIAIQRLVAFPELVAPHRGETPQLSKERLVSVAQAWPQSASQLTDEDLSIVRELFGPTFLSPDYFLTDFELIGV